MQKTSMTSKPLSRFLGIFNNNHPLYLSTFVHCTIDMCVHYADKTLKKLRIMIEPAPGPVMCDRPVQQGLVPPRPISGGSVQAEPMQANPDPALVAAERG